MDILNLWNRDDQTVEVTERHVKDIRDWLERLDLIATCRVRRSDGSDDMPRTIFTQPGMRYCQAQALVFAIGADRRMRRFGESVMSRVCETILNDVRGRIVSRVVYYRGPDFDHASGVKYRNVENYLSGLLDARMGVPVAAA